MLAGGALAGWAIFAANPDSLRDVDPGMRGVVCAMGLAFLPPGLGALYWARGIARCLAADRSAGVRHDHP